ncbi:MAG: hypothetical protein ABSE95_05880 [Thermodesulfobacteriota bacterium]
MKRQIICIVMLFFVIGICSICSADSTGNALSAKSFSLKGKVWLPDGDKLIQVNSVAGYVEMSAGQALRQAFTFKKGYSIFANGTKAKIRLKTSPTVIYTRHDPSESGVALLTVEENRRSIWVEQKAGSNLAEFSPEENDMKYDEEMIEDDIYKLTFRKPLKPGEYGFITPGGHTKYLIYDFAVEP